MSLHVRGLARLRLSRFALALAAAYALPAFAQTADKPASEATELSTVRVEAEQEKSPATENTGAYVTPQITIGKQPLSVLDTPQSVTVITRQRIDDQNLTSLPDILKEAPGVTVLRFDGAGYFSNYYVRGFQVDAIQLDGLAFGNAGNVTEYDTYIYDRVEILKGPSGLFQGAGEPGASINLARKRALADSQVKGGLQAGSWDMTRYEADVTGSLSDDGSLRGRVVTTYDKRDSYLDVVGSTRQTTYATVEYDLSPSTTVSVGGTRQQIDSVIDQGLPAYADGRLLDVSRAKFIGAAWNEQDIETKDIFADIEHRFANGGLFKIAARSLSREMLYRVARANSAVDANGNVALQTGLYTVNRDNLALDAYASLPFSLWGREHHVIAGADVRDQDEISHSSAFANTATQNVFSPDYAAVLQPAFDINASITQVETRQYGTYGQLRLSLLEPLTLVAGGRLTWWRSQNKNVKTNASTPAYDADGQFTPFAALLYKLTSNLTAYTSYADVFVPQSQLTSDLQQIEPRVGAQYEAGVKGEWLRGELITQTAVFRIEDENRAITDVDNPLYSVPQGKVRSQGFEAEAMGQALPALNISLGYTYVDTEYLTGASAAQTGTLFSTFTPRHTVKLWGKYKVEGGLLDGLSVGAGVRTSSSFYSLGGTTAAPVKYSASDYVVFNGSLGYRLSPNWNLNLTGNNLLDKKYYEKLSAAGRQNFYGAPRSFTLALRAEF